MAAGGAGGKGGLDFKALVKSISEASGVKEQQAQKVVRATLAALSKNIGKDETTRIPGLGVFKRKTKDGNTRVTFRPQGARAGKKKEKPAAAG